MKIKEKLMLDYPGLCEHGPIDIVIFGDSVSHGAVNGYIDYENVYWNQLKKRMNQFRDYVPVNMINASIGGTSAKQSIARLERDVLIHNPDLVIVCFGLNDVNFPLNVYLSSMETIFRRCLDAGLDVIFMTPNMLNSYVADDTEPHLRPYALKMSEIQSSGKMDEYMGAAVSLAQEMGVTVCDCYARWKELSKTKDTTLLLANRINHPISEMHQLFADVLYDVIMGEAQNDQADETTMFQE